MNDRPVSGDVVETDSAEMTQAFAERLGRLLRSGDVIGLSGDLGAGKTTFTQGLARGLGLPEDDPVNSPTYTLVAEHPGDRVSLFHFDVYRLSGAADLADLGFEEYLERDGVVVIEWADTIADALPIERLDIQMTALDTDHRQLRLTPYGARAQEILALL